MPSTDKRKERIVLSRFYCSAESDWGVDENNKPARMMAFLTGKETIKDICKKLPRTHGDITIFGIKGSEYGR